MDNKDEKPILTKKQEKMLLIFGCLIHFNTLVLYAAGSFYSASFDISLWSEGTKLIIIVFWFLFFFASIGITDILTN